jgi:GDP-4-dehydro-6-deoxy-D-mannose reductase
MSGATLVTGAGGFAGRHLLHRLTGEHVIAWHRPGSAIPPASSSIRWRAVDVGDASAVADAIVEDRPAKVFHLAGAAHAGHAWVNVIPYLETNVFGTHHLLEAVRRLESRTRILIASSALVYQTGPSTIDEAAPLRPETPYGMSKLAQEHLALQAMHDDGVEIVIARSFNHVGPGQDPSFAVSSFARQIAMIEGGRAAPVIRVGNLDASRDITDVRDVVDAYARVMQDGVAGRPYNVCSGRAVRMREVLDELRRLSKVSVSVEVDENLLRPTDPAVFIGDGSRIRRELGWSSRRPLAETLRETLDEWRAQVAA